MQGDHLDALVTAAADGIAFDGVTVEPDGDGYTFEVDGDRRAVEDDEQLRAVASEYPAYSSNWYFWHALAPQKEDRWAFLRWLENAAETGVEDRYEALEDGVETEWGQLRITAELADDGIRRYRIVHEHDAGTDPDDLVAYEDPLEARTLAKHGDSGQYRPLKTAPTLQTGWTFVDLSATALVQTVEFFYPATIANWHREREGELDVNHWRETMERQSGIYGVVQTWDRGEGHEHVEWVAEACCDDSQCLKRREWDYDDETELAVDGGELAKGERSSSGSSDGGELAKGERSSPGSPDGGDGVFPCREPCSLVVSAARKWTKLEGEQSRTYEFELTPSEKEQIEAIVDAVAEGRIDEIREADAYDDANRYRARFLRAKRFDDEGNLCGVETEDEKQ